MHFLYFVLFVLCLHNVPTFLVLLRLEVNFEPLRPRFSGQKINETENRAATWWNRFLYWPTSFSLYSPRVIAILGQVQRFLINHFENAIRWYSIFDLLGSTTEMILWPEMDWNDFPTKFVWTEMISQLNFKVASSSSSFSCCCYCCCCCCCCCLLLVVRPQRNAASRSFTRPCVPRAAPPFQWMDRMWCQRCTEKNYKMWLRC